MTAESLFDRTITVVEGGTGVAGAVVYWSLTSGTSQDAIIEELEARGLGTDDVPEPPSPETALRRVMHRRKPSGCVLYPARGVTYVLSEDELEDDGGPVLDVTLTAQWGVTLNALGMLDFVGDPPPDAEDIRGDYMHELFTLSTTDISAWLLGLVQRSDALMLRDCGGVYFIPRDTLDTFAQHIEALHAVSKCRVHFMPAMHSSTAMESILDSLTSEVATFVETVGAELSSGDLGTRAVENRRAATSRMLEKVSRFENLLGRTLDELRENLTTLEGAEVATTFMTLTDDDE